MTSFEDIFLVSLSPIPPTVAYSARAFIFNMKRLRWLVKLPNALEGRAPTWRLLRPDALERGKPDPDGPFCSMPGHPLPPALREAKGLQPRSPKSYKG